MSLLSADSINNFSTILLSIILEGFPFIIIGALISSVIQVFVSEETIRRIIPKNKFLGIVFMGFIGILFPICECGIVPIARRLIKKGVPINMAITFMLSVPIMNPIVLMSTYYAFLGKPSMLIMRAVAGVISAITIGYLIGELHTSEALVRQKLLSKGTLMKPVRLHRHEHHDDSCGCGHCHDERNSKGIIGQVVGHASHELYDIGRFFIMGAVLSAIMQTFIPKNYILAIGGGTLSSIVVMMCIAFLLSVCSETDAFIARTFVGQFTNGSIIAFLIFGPMLDLKNAIMLTSSFNFKFVTKLLFLIVTICFLVAVGISFIPLF